MTLHEALLSGYQLGDTKLERIYVSRKVDPARQPVKTAGGRRKGDLYVLLPNWRSTVYSYRQYLIKPIPT